MVSPRQDKVSLRNQPGPPRLGPVDEELDHGPRREEQGERGPRRGRRAQVEVRVHSGQVLVLRRHISVGVRGRGNHAAVVVFHTNRGLRAAVEGGIPMRQAVPDLRQENGECQDRPEEQGGKVRPAKMAHGTR